jgi:20S proteasome alpha/beta subunit
MSLVVAIETGAGLVMAADKRQYDLIRGDQDSVDKLHPIDNLTAFSATGYVGFADPVTFAPIFDVKQSIRDFYRNRGVEIPASFDGLCQELFQQFLTFWANHPSPAVGLAKGEALYQVVFFHCAAGTPPRYSIP